LSKARRILLSKCALGDVEEQLRRSPKVIVPVGATEQHGPYAPLGTDSILATEVCVGLAHRIDALVAPALTYGRSGTTVLCRSPVCLG
jgi:creatinine amidohydrolase/Fe(II)-dependent formamide hydrolase-like protein